MHSYIVYLILFLGSLILGTRPALAPIWFGSSLPLCMVLFWCTVSSRERAVAGALLGGLVVDGLSSCPTGTHALSYAVTAWLMWEALQILLTEKWTVQLLLAGYATLSCSVVTEILLTLSGRPALPLQTVYSVAAGESATNALLLPILRSVMGRWWQWPLQSEAG